MRCTWCHIHGDVPQAALGMSPITERTGQGRVGGQSRREAFKAPNYFCNHENEYLGSSRLKHIHLLAAVVQQAPCLTAPIAPSSLGQLGGCWSQLPQGGFASFHSLAGLCCSSLPTVLPAVSGQVTHSPAPCSLGSLGIPSTTSLTVRLCAHQRRHQQLSNCIRLTFAAFSLPQLHFIESHLAPLVCLQIHR